MRRIPYLPAAACCLIMGLFALPVPAAAPDPAGIPVKGMTMDEVAGARGQPREVRAAVGDPPITRWIYDEYTVYFEHEHVIHSVLSRDDIAPTDSGPGADRMAAGEPAAD